MKKNFTLIQTIFAVIIFILLSGVVYLWVNNTLKFGEISKRNVPQTQEESKVEEEKFEEKEQKEKVETKEESVSLPQESPSSTPPPASSSTSPSPPPEEQPTLPETGSHQRLDISFFKGVWAQPGGEERALKNDIEKMKKDGVNIFAFSVLYHTNHDGTVEIISPNYKWNSDPEGGYINLIRMAHNARLGVYLNIDFDHWWEDQKFLSVSEKVKNKFLESAKKASLYWAEIGEREQVEMFSPMNEPTNILGKKEGIKWMEDILPDIKKKFKGKTNVALFGAEVGDLSSYGSIAGYDYVSVNVYTIDTSNKEFLDYIKYDVVPYMENLVKKYNLKGYLFGEMGVPASNEKQDKVFQEFFEITWNNTSGYFLSGWGPKIMLDDPFPDMQFTGYDAENVIKNWYNLAK